MIGTSNAKVVISQIDQEKISIGNLALFKEHKLLKLSENDCILFDTELTVPEMEKIKWTWNPGNYRQDLTGEK